jgi:hypothetical protein
MSNPYSGADRLGVPRHLADDIAAIVATLRPVVVTA